MKLSCSLSRFAPSLLAAFVLSCVAACSGGGAATTSNPPARTLTSIAVTSASASVAAGLTDQFKATGTYSDSTTSDITSTVSWTSATPAVATINASGLASSKTQGTSLITATSGSVTASATLTVSSPALTALTVTPASGASANLSVAVGQTEQFKAIGTFTDSSSSDLTSAVSWTSATPAVATIDAAGLATSKTQGTALISATSGALTASLTLTVTPPALVSIAIKQVKVQMGSAAQMTATGTYTDQSTQDLTSTVAWSSLNSYVATINSFGVLDPLHAGSSAIVAKQGGISAGTNIGVFADPNYLYVAADAGRSVTRMVIDGTSGQPRFLGYHSSDLYGSIGFPCLTVDPSGTHAYLSTQVKAITGSGYAGSVAIYSVDSSSGTLTALPGSPFSLSMPLGCLKFVPSGKFAYATSGIENAGDQLGTFTVNSDATLTLSNTLNLPHYPTGVAIDPTGQFAFSDVVDVAGGTNGSSQLYGYSIDSSTGNLTPLEGSPWSLTNGIYGELAFDPSGTHLYASDLNSTTITEFAFNLDLGTPTKIGTADSTCINPSALQFLPDQSYAYALCGESSGRSVSAAPVVEFAVGGDGKVTAQSTAFAGPTAKQMQVDDAGKFLYVLGTGSDSTSSSGSTTAPTNMVLEYQIQSDGSLKLTQQIAGHVQGNAMVLLSGPKPLKWTTTSAYVTTSGDNTVTLYTVASDGTLTAGASVSTASGPFSASMLPWGSNLLFATQSAAPNLYAYDTSAVALSTGMSFGSAASPGGIVISPDGQEAYASDPSAGAVDAFQRIQGGTWGPLRDTNAAPVVITAASGAGPIGMDASGRYIAVGNQTARSISLIELMGGSATPDTALSYGPLALTFDGTGNLLFVAGDDGKLHMLSSNGQGTLTELATATLLGTNSATLAVDPSSRFVYAAGPSGLDAFSFDATAKTLTPISLQLPAPLAGATGAFLDPSGSFLYVPVSSGSTNAMYLFTVNADGTLTYSSANPVAAPNHATSMVFRTNVQ